MSDPHNEFKGKNVLIERKDPSEMASKYGMSVEEYYEILGECRHKLFEVRSKRPRPHLDDKVFRSTLLGFRIFMHSQRDHMLLGDCVLEWAGDLFFC